MTDTLPCPPDALPPRPIRLFWRGAVHEIRAVPPTRSLLDWLRETQRATGTKEGCNEGDCGACTVLLGELDAAAPGGLRLRNVNACLTFLPTLDGRAVFTVEDLAGFGLADGAAAQPHPVQQALVAQHASQCGFCTPGFAMTLAALYEQRLAGAPALPREGLADALAGNLCRCTGYRPLLDAAAGMTELQPPRPLDRAPVVAALQALRERAAQDDADATFVYEGPDAADPTDPAAPRQRFLAPRRLETFARLRAALPEARLLAGATDIGLWVNKQFRDLGSLLSINEVAELRRIEVDATGLNIGAGARLEEAWAALAAAVPTLEEVWRRFAAPPLRHAGTLGGNIANGSPIGDGAPVLMALGARLGLRRGEQQRELALEDFYLGYLRNALQPGEFVERLRVPRPPPGTQVRAWKIAKRWDSDISAVCGAFSLRLDEAGRVAALRLAWGGLAATVKRAARAEAALLGQPWDEAHLEQAVAALAQDFQPIDDLRASAAYRMRVAGQLLRRLWLETRPVDPLPATMTCLRPAPATPREPA
ncbi:MAG: xanthine dehydrogenase small subunit [Burkholderiaceae bacterium]|nr:xanthine dehydrogenase small subunit [Burkholderiaceae bacterium]